MTNKKRGLLINNGFMGLHGFASVMIGTTLPEMIRSFDLNLSQGGFIVTAQSAGAMVLMLLGMVLADRVRKPVWIVGSVIAAGLSIAAIGLAPGYWFLVVVFFVTGVIVQILDTLLNAFTGDIASGTRTRALNLLHMLYGVGAFIGPTFARWLLNQSISWSGVYWIVGAIYLAAGAGSLIWIRGYLALEPAPEPVPHSDTDASAVATKAPATARAWGSVVLIGLALLFYSVHQMGTSAWLPLYMESILGAGKDLASLALSLYWMGIIASRLLASILGARLGEIRILVGGCLIGGAALTGAVVLASPAVAIVGFVFAGVTTGASIPLAMSLAYGHVPGRTAVVTSVIYGVMTIGRLSGPWMVGIVGDRLGLQAGVLIAAAVLLMTSVIAGAVAIRDRYAL